MMHDVDPQEVEVFRLSLAPQPTTLRDAVAHFDLVAIVDEQRREHVPELDDSISIAWGTGRRGRKLQSIRMAAYAPVRRLIIVHPRLDDRRIPPWVIGCVVHHELLHALFGVAHGNHHPPEFRRRERAHPDFARAAQWERDYLPALLSARW